MSRIPDSCLKASDIGLSFFVFLAWLTQKPLVHCLSPSLGGSCPSFVLKFKSAVFALPQLTWRRCGGCSSWFENLSS